MAMRIFFRDSPWPCGLLIDTLRWWGVLHPTRGIFFRFCLRTIPFPEQDEQDRRHPDQGYDRERDCGDCPPWPVVDEDADEGDADEYQEDDFEDRADEWEKKPDEAETPTPPGLVAEEDASRSWDTRATWDSGEACCIRSRYDAHHPGLCAASAGQPFVCHAPEIELFADPLPARAEDVLTSGAFEIELYDWPAAADHHIRLTRLNEFGEYGLDWTGRIAFAYSGREDFQHAFRIRADRIRCEGISMEYFTPQFASHFGLDLNGNGTLHDWLAPFVAEPGRYYFFEHDGTLYANWY